MAQLTQRRFARFGPDDTAVCNDPATCMMAVVPVFLFSDKCHLLRKRLRQLGRVLLVVTIGLAVDAGALAIWWLNSLNGLPDIGDPFDVAAFRATHIPNDRNAFTFFRQAEEKLTPQPFLPPAMNRSAVMASWTKTDPRLRAWGEENRQALELFQQGAELADASLDLSGDPLSFHNSEVNPNTMIVLVLASPLSQGPPRAGDHAGHGDLSP